MVFQPQLGCADVKVNHVTGPEEAAFACNLASGGFDMFCWAGRDTAAMTEECWQVTYVIVILADTAPEAAEKVLLLQGIQATVKEP